MDITVLGLFFVGLLIIGVKALNIGEISLCFFVICSVISVVVFVGYVRLRIKQHQRNKKRGSLFPLN